MPINEIIVGTAVKAVASTVTKECVKEHLEDIRNVRDSAVNTVNQAVDQGWERDYNAGGVSSWGNKPKTATS